MFFLNDYLFFALILDKSYTIQILKILASRRYVKLLKYVNENFSSRMNWPAKFFNPSGFTSSIRGSRTKKVCAISAWNVDVSWTKFFGPIRVLSIVGCSNCKSKLMKKSFMVFKLNF
jgi:hypothetical protein